MVWQIFPIVKIPIIGIGGLCSSIDALEFIMAGATALGIGTALFKDPLTPIKILEGIEEFLVEEGLTRVTELKGVAHCQ